MAGLSVFAAGCSGTQGLVGALPGPAWPDPERPVPSAGGVGAHVPPSTPTQAQHTPGRTPAYAAVGPVRAIPRSSWAQADPIKTRLNNMGAIRRITVHHEGWTPFWDNDTASVADRLELIRKSHLKRLSAGDIGYHFVIDRSGRLWQGRELGYQGAHVKNYNPNNVGIMCLGNFELQQPTRAQTATLRDTTARLMRQYRVPAKQVYTHRELNPTVCPGKSLQLTMDQLRNNGGLA